MIFLKNFAIIIIQGKGKIPCKVKKKISKKKLKKLLTNKRKHVIIVTQGKESQRSQPLKKILGQAPQSESERRVRKVD